MVALWASAAIASLAIVVTNEVRSGGIMTRNQATAVQDRIAADSAVIYAAEMLRTRKVDRAGSLSFTFESARVSIKITPESSLVDLNTAPIDVIEPLMTMATSGDDTLAMSLTHAVLDWRDDNDLRHAEGAEAREYRHAGRDDLPPNAPFRTLVELQDVLGMTDQIYDRLIDEVTIYSGMERPFEVTLASPPAHDTDEVDDTIEQEADDTPVFLSDPNNLYRLDIIVTNDDGSRHRSVATVRTESDHGFDILGFQRQLILQEESF